MTHVSTSEVGGSYALDNDAPTAGRILDCLAAILDDHTTELLQQAMNLPRPGRRCLELGAGNGSVAAWLAHAVARDGGGEVIAVDIKPQHVEEAVGVTVLGLDIVRDGWPAGPFDVIHARLLLAHLAQRHDVLHRCVDALAPGGVLLVEEWGADGPSRILSDPDGVTTDLYQRYIDTLVAMFADSGHDPTWCTGLHAAMTAAGLVDVATTTHARSWLAGTAGCELPIAVSTEKQDRLLAHGMTAAELDRLRVRLADPATVVLGNRTWSTLGRKPL